MLQPVEAWLAEYGESHQHKANKAIHWVCVPLIVLSLIGMLWSLPVPHRFAEASPVLNWGTLFLMAAIVYYFIMSFALAIGMLPVCALLVYAVWQLKALAIPLWLSSLTIFLVAWIGQFVGHLIEGEKPSFFKDLQFLMIGPLWLLAFLYRKLRIPY